MPTAAPPSRDEHLAHVAGTLLLAAMVGAVGWLCALAFRGAVTPGAAWVVLVIAPAVIRVT